MAALTQPGRSRRWLSGLNFFLADVRDGLGPFLGVFLMSHGWQADEIGYLMAAAGLAGMLATTPMGAWVDATRHKRALLAISTVVLLVCNLVLWATPYVGVTATTQILSAIVGAVFGPAILGLTLGMVGPQGLARQLGSNEAWNHAGNVVAAALAGVAGYRWGFQAVFGLMTLMACGSLWSLRKISARDIDHELARGSHPINAAIGANRPASSSIWQVLTESRDLQLLAVTMMLFHLANAAMLPLLGQAAVARGQADPAAYTAMTIIVAQGVMIPVALAAGRIATRLGYWPLVTVALVSLVVRGVIAAAWPSPWALVPAQILDGIGAGLLGVALPGLVARLLQGSGRVNAGLGAVMTVQGMGAALSPALAGWLAHRFGYAMAFAALSGIAMLALAMRLGIRKDICLQKSPS